MSLSEVMSHEVNASGTDLAHTKYRADIDGLRAVAVLSVLGYHVFPDWIHGGFVGVDVFFVISGFLISTIILGSLDRGVFKFKEFYTRRIVRIFPALITVLSFCFVLGWFTLYADEYKQLGKHIAGGAGFLSNFVFWKEAGYFDVATELKPLLHLWSLGIEEQFYIVWPLTLFLVFFFWKRKDGFLSLILLLAAASFVYSVMHIKTDVTAMFYSPVSRAWELMLGSILSYLVLFHRFVPISAGVRASNSTQISLIIPLNNIYGALRIAKSLAGIALILIAVFLLKKTDPFPGLLALLPAVGAGLLISAGEDAWFNRYVLSSRVLVWFGLISFPLYLWHWPLLSFARIFENGDPRLGIRIAVVIVSILLAWLTYRFIEKPIRYGGLKSQKAVVLCFLMISIGCAGYSSYRYDGFLFREFLNMNKYNFETPATVNSVAGLFQKDCSFQSVRFDRTYNFVCRSDSRDVPEYALIGDSKANALYPSLIRNSSNHRWLLIENFPLMSHSEIYSHHWLFQQGAAEALIDWLAANADIKVIVITVSIRNLFALSPIAALTLEELPKSPNYRIAYDGLNLTIKRMIAANKKVVITIDNPTLMEPRHCVQRKSEIPCFSHLFAMSQNPGCRISFDKHTNFTEQYFLLINNLKVENPQLVIYNPTHILCNIGENECSHMKDGKLLYSYADHISTYAASLIAKELVPIVDNLAN